MKRPILGITMGDPFGNGPEITVKALADKTLYDRCRPLVVGDVSAMEYAARAAKKVSGIDMKIRKIQAVGEASYEYGVIDVYDLGLVKASDIPGDPENPKPFGLGATALGGLSPGLSRAGYQLIYVINRYRVLSQTPEECAALLSEIEAASRLKAAGIVNNSHLGVETTMEHVLDALDFAKRTAELTGLPLLYSTVPDFALDGREPPEGFKAVRRLVKFAWE